MKGYLDKVPVNGVTRFEQSLLSDVKARAPEILAAIRTDREIKKETEAKLLEFLDAFANSFS